MLLTPIEIKIAIFIALDSLRVSKFRSALTILGVMIGVSSVIGLASVINGLDGAFNQEIDSQGSNSIMITKLPFDFDRDKMTEEERNRPGITVGEALAIRDNCPHVDGISPQNYYFKPGGNQVKYKNRKGNNPRVLGVWSDYLKVTNSSIGQGRFINDMDEQFRAMVCVIGNTVADGIFENENPIGKEIRVNGQKFLVVGVLENKESNFDDGARNNNNVIMPLSTFEKIHPWEEELFLIAQADTYENIDIAKDEITSALRKFRKVPFDKANNFALSTQDNLKEMVSDITNYIYLAMMTITSVGLMVGGIGVMNVMLVSVTERTREIGVRKALGAKRSNIILQFLTEALTLSGIGGIVGIIFGVIFGSVINFLLGFPPGISVFWIVVGFTVSVTVGLISGIYPAYKASRLDPIDALRYE